MRTLIILCVVIPSLLFSQQRGITTNLPDIKVQVVEPVTTQLLPSIQAVPSEIPFDYNKKWQILPSGSYSAIKFNKSQEKLEVIKPDFGLSSNVLAAINSSPHWLQPALLDNMRRLPAAKQETFAQTILNASKDVRDEIAFQVAYLAPQTLNTVDPRLIVDNAEYIYVVGGDLKYVKLVEYDDNKGDWYTTTKYRVIKDGDSVWVEIPKETYYWWIVMPKLSDEPPLMDASVYNEFWRRHLYNNADVDYPILKEVIKDVKVMWDCKGHQWQNFDSLNNRMPFVDTMQALQIVGQWTGQTVWGEAKDPRPVQPNQILYDHDGNCGELQDLFNAGARTVLMPVNSVGSLPGDHVWCELYEQGNWWTVDVWRWRGPTNITREFRYPDKGCIFRWRGDGSVSLVNEHYQPVCTLTVKVVDQSSKPVDGAEVMFFAAPYSDPHGNQLYLGSWLYTDENGELEVLLGTNINYGFRVDWSNGHNPDVYNRIFALLWNQQGFVEGGHLVATINAGGSTPPNLQITNQTSQGLDHYKLNIEYQVPYRIVYGNSYWQQANFGLDDYQWHDLRSPGHIDFFICDEENYQKFSASQPFNAYFVHQNSESGQIEFSLPQDKDYYVVYANRSKVTTSEVVQTKVELYKKNNASWDLIDAVGAESPTTDVTEKTHNSLRIEIHPNPASNYLMIKLLDNFGSDISVKIFNSLGMEVFQKGYSIGANDAVHINISELPRGIYYAVIKGENAVSSAKFLVVK